MIDLMISAYQMWDSTIHQTKCGRGTPHHLIVDASYVVTSTIVQDGEKCFSSGGSCDLSRCLLCYLGLSFHDGRRSW